ncbi:endoplasmic reticulum membrane-associated RNA degradation protein-like [Babylonia areolata]|uniref:endoplasmic reticulum membrane-associated RNA degradation protein-like n=1 Tax=Babylonia areolata TaxID=304850 RepID=UPI003FD262E9
MNLPSPATALSPAVKHLICSVGCESDEHGNVVLTEERESETVDSRQNGPFVLSHGGLDMDRIASLFPVDSDNTAEYFQEAVQVLAPVFAQCQSCLRALSFEQIEATLMPRLQWTQSQKIFHDCLTLLREQQEDNARNILVLLLVTAVLERALGNVYLVAGSQCPSMLKDLLVTEELTSTLGISAIQILRAVIGPPTSLNLRNVAWHGFLGDKELPRRYCCFLVILAASIGDVLTGKGLCDIPQRPFFVWTPAVKGRLRAALQMTDCGEEGTDDHQCVKRLLRESGITQPHTQQQWDLALRLYAQGRAACFLPACDSQGFHVYRVATRVVHVYHVNLCDCVPCNLLGSKRDFLVHDLLHDVLFYPEGPRVRDHLSHGEVEFHAVDDSVVTPFLHVAVFLARRLSPLSALLDCTQCTMMEHRVQSYRSMFHPVAVLQHKFAELLQHLENLAALPLTQMHQTLEGQDGGRQSEDNALLTRTQETVNSLQRQQGEPNPNNQPDHHGLELHMDVVRKACHLHIPTLYRWQHEAGTERVGVMRESECVGLLVRVTEEVSTVVRQVQSTVQLRHQQLTAKQLRSRQRDNLRKLLLCTPCLRILVSAVCAAISWCLQCLPDFSSLTAPQCRLLQKFLKAMLQQCENLRTLTSPEKNKWTESVELLLTWVPTCRRFLLTWHQQSA